MDLLNVKKKFKKCVKCGRGNEFWWYSEKGLCLGCDHLEKLKIKRNNTLEKWLK